MDLNGHQGQHISLKSGVECLALGDHALGDAVAPRHPEEVSTACWRDPLSVSWRETDQGWRASWRTRKLRRIPATLWVKMTPAAFFRPFIYSMAAL